MKILVISGSPKKNGNTETLIRWFSDGVAAAMDGMMQGRARRPKGRRPEGADIEIVRAASLALKAAGCNACRVCQKNRKYACVIKDDASRVIVKMAAADIVVMATPLYFFSMSAQLKVIMDRMFALYKWDNDAGTMETVMEGKMLVLLASAYEDVGLRELEYPFRQTADYTGMRYASLLVPNAGVSGEIRKLEGIRGKTIAFGRRIIESL